MKIKRQRYSIQIKIKLLFLGSDIAQGLTLLRTLLEFNYISGQRSETGEVTLTDILLWSQAFKNDLDLACFNEALWKKTTTQKHDYLDE